MLKGPDPRVRREFAHLPSISSRVIVASFYRACGGEKSRAEDKKPRPRAAPAHTPHTQVRKRCHSYRARLLQSRKNFRFPRERSRFNGRLINGLQVDGSPPL